MDYNFWKWDFENKKLIPVFIILGCLVFLLLWDWKVIFPIIDLSSFFGYFHLFLFGLEVTSFSGLFTIITILASIRIFLGFMGGIIGKGILLIYNLLLAICLFYPLGTFQARILFAIPMAIDINFSLFFGWIALFYLCYISSQFSFNIWLKYYIPFQGEVIPAKVLSRDPGIPVIRVQKEQGRNTYQFPQNLRLDRVEGRDLLRAAKEAGNIAPLDKSRLIKPAKWRYPKQHVNNEDGTTTYYDF